MTKNEAKKVIELISNYGEPDSQDVATVIDMIDGDCAVLCENESKPSLPMKVVDADHFINRVMNLPGVSFRLFRKLKRWMDEEPDILEKT